ncbi:MAG: ribosome maturation factor RimP [Deltaproteobacteria bacterium]|nr:ribosome maturation factor RimP [Deltaproteobacteria bacterium]
MRSLSTIEQKVKDLVLPILQERALELVEVEYVPDGGRMVLRLYIDCDNGVTVDDCSGVSRELSMTLDVEEVVPGDYSLEVSSPGLARPLTRDKDFLAAVGKKIKLNTKLPVDGRKNFKVTLLAFKDKKITIEDSLGDSWTFDLDDIDRARLEVEF